ncbi:MAG: alkaline phosphatase D family protein [Ilumatobacteraceae bacterium]
MTHFVVDGLEPDTRYWYALELDGEIDRVRVGSFRTFPDAARPLRLAFGSCARTGSNGAVFDAIRAADPDLYACIGDFHYGDIFVDDVDDYRQVFDVQLTRPAQAALYASVPIAYVWDDHDYGPNDSNADAPGRNAAMVAFREYVPHYELAGPESAVFQAFSIGSVRVIMTDARSARDPQSDPDGPDKSMLGEEQRRWLLDELSNSAPDHDVVIWVNPVPWVDPAEPGADSWAGYDAERRLIAQHIVDEGIDHLVMVAGDAHMVAIDDGTHTDYADTGGRGFPLIHVAALDRPGSTKGGPYTQGPITGGGHFALVEVTPTDTGVDVTLAATDWRGDDLLRHEVSFPRRTTS